MNGLEGLAQGLRSAGGILSPNVYRSNIEQDQRYDQQMQADRMMQIQQTVKGIEMGAIEPEAGKAVLAKLGFQAPVGVGPEAQARQDAVAKKRAMADTLAKLPPDATFEQRMGAMAPHMSIEESIKVHDLLVNKKAAADAKLFQMESLHEARMARLGTEQERIAETKRHNLEREGQERENARIREAIGQLGTNRDEDRRQAAVERQVTQFANKLQDEKVPGLRRSFIAANEILGRYENRKDIPGIGTLEGSTMYPNWWRSEASKDLRSALQAVSNDLLNMYSGLAVTPPEEIRRDLEAMRGGDFTDVDLKNAWPRMVDRFNDIMGNMRAGASPAVYNEYLGRPGALKLDPLTPAFDAKRKAAAATRAGQPSPAAKAAPVAPSGDPILDKARAAIASGKDKASVRQRYKEVTGKDMP